ncbi:uncharacterized protein [Miscanthus floridulus]|uniref:uncharacterized protein n=1 Tax=Miscanthus floridulus TaxID=154761 RepID=UPI00345A7B2F
MQIVPRSILGVGRVGSDLLRLCRWRCPPEFARRDAPIMASASAHLNLDRLSRSIYKPWSLIPFACNTTKCMDTDNLRTKATDESHIYFTSVLTNSSHRDGTIYKNKLIQKEFEGDIADRAETRLEPMMFPKATERCLPNAENCMYHFPQQIFQFFSVRLSKSPIGNGPIQLYGYIAARDERDGMLNYVVNYSRDDPIVVHQGDLIEMTGPKRCIAMDYIVLIEFDMRIKNEAMEDDDQQLIDGAISCSCYNYRAAWKPVVNRITGSSGAVDVSLAVVDQAVEATIEVVISQVLSGLNLSLSSFVEVMDVYEEIKLFNGKISQSGSLRRFVVSVSHGTTMLLMFKVGNNVQGSLHGCASRQMKFQAKLHGRASRQIKLKFATISVKVTWSTI